MPKGIHTESEKIAPEKVVMALSLDVTLGENNCLLTQWSFGRIKTAMIGKFRQCIVKWHDSMQNERGYVGNVPRRCETKLHSKQRQWSEKISAPLQSEGDEKSIRAHLVVLGTNWAEK